jgi:hypothetical protein
VLHATYLTLVCSGLLTRFLEGVSGGSFCLLTHMNDGFEAMKPDTLCWFLCLCNLEVSSIFVCLYQPVSQPECVSSAVGLYRAGFSPLC